MYTTGRLCMKIAGRDAGKYCLVVDEKDDRVLIDGQTRRRMVNKTHLEPLTQQAKIKKGASTEEVQKALVELGYEMPKQKKTPRKAKPASKATAKKAKE